MKDVKRVEQGPDDDALYKASAHLVMKKLK